MELGKRTLAGPDYAKYLADDLIVATPHLGLVVKKLDAAGVVIGKQEHANALGLTRITLANPASAAQDLEKWIANTKEAGAAEPLYPRPADDLDLVIWSLRGLFAADYAGWTPTIGKNRVTGRVHGAGEQGEISHGGGGDPQKTGRKLPPREAGPGKGVRVGVLDTALYPNPWLAGGWAARSSDRIPEGVVPPFADGHATFVAGLILSQAPAATVEVRKVLEDGVADSWRVALEIVRFGRSGLDVLNLSLVCYTDDGQPPMALSAAIDRLDPDLVVVAAAGNHGDLSDRRDRTKPGWPAALDDVTAVGSSTAGGAARATFTPDAPWIDLVAEGVDLVSTYLPAVHMSPGDKSVDFGGVARWNGTSFSAALISGAIAAGTDPGRVSAREALDDLTGAALARRPGAIGKTQAPFVPLRTL